MELRVLNYFLTIAREQSFSAAAKSLHLSQPTLSTQIKALEEELGKPLLIRNFRGSRRIQLTEEGFRLKKRAEEIFALVRMTQKEIALPNEDISGDVYIGMGESHIIRHFAQAAKHLNQKHPHVQYHLLSGNADFVQEHLDRGLIDFGVIYSPVDPNEYHCIKIPFHDTWGVLMRKDDPLAQKTSITPNDLRERPLILSTPRAEDWPASILSDWFGEEVSKLQVVATYNLLFNASLLVEEGLGYAISFDRLINVSGDSPLCFRPLHPPRIAEASIIWKRYQVLSKAAEAFLCELKNILLLPCSIETGLDCI